MFFFLGLSSWMLVLGLVPSGTEMCDALPPHGYGKSLLAEKAMEEASCVFRGWVTYAGVEMCGRSF